ncbi:MAG: HAD-IIA family hydrolase [Verrucomicrobiales bacterium]|nr:HAD-IIA family hydrolase [Verrucomicrobiales bacterium]
MTSPLRQVRHVALDMDGTIYRGGTLFDCTVPFLTRLGELGIGYTFLTNNPSKSRADYLRHLQDLGVPATAGQLYTSTQAAIEFIREEHPAVHRLFALATPGLNTELEAAGFELMPDHPDAEPDAVVVGFDTTLTYARLCRAAWWISRGKPWFATNPDRVCPTDQPTVLVDCGSLCASLETATGRPPTAVLGKPDPAMLRGILHGHDLQPEELAMVGDRLYTDVEMARRAGAVGVLVLTGETRAEDVAQAAHAPDLVVPSLKELGLLLQENSPTRSAS